MTMKSRFLSAGATTATRIAKRRRQHAAPEGERPRRAARSRRRNPYPVIIATWLLWLGLLGAIAFGTSHSAPTAGPDATPTTHP